MQKLKKEENKNKIFVNKIIIKINYKIYNVQ